MLHRGSSTSSSRSRLFLLDVGTLSISAIISRALLLGRDLVLAHILGPVTYGVWTQMLVIFSYALHLPLGFQHAMSRDVPYYLGQGNQPQIKSIQDVAFMVTLSTAILAGSGIMLVYWLFDYRLFHFSFLELLTATGVVIAQQLYAFYSILLRAHQKFIIFSIGFTAVALLSLTFAVVAAPHLGAKGVALALGGAYILVTCCWLRHTEFRLLDIGFPLRESLRLARLAIPLFAVGLSSLLLISIDRLAVASFYSEEQIGYYGLAFLLKQSIYLLATPLMQAISPRLMKASGRHQDPHRVKHYLILMTFAMGNGAALLIGVLYLLIGDLLPLFLPQFAPTVETGRILLLGATFSVLGGGATAFLVALYKQSQVLKIQISVIAIQAVSIGVIIHLGGGISQIAGVMALSYIIYATLSLFWAERSVEHSTRRRLVSGLKTFLPICYVLASAVFVSLWHVQAVRNAYLVAIIHLLAWGLVTLPAYFYLFWELHRVKRQVAGGPAKPPNDSQLRE